MSINTNEIEISPHLQAIADAIEADKGGKSKGLTQAQIDAALWPEADNGFTEGPEHPFIPLSERRGKTPAITLGWRPILQGVVKGWHSELNSKAVAKAHTELLAALDVAQEAADAVSALKAEQGSEDEDLAAQARADAAAGIRGESFERTDWASEKSYREERWRLAHTTAHNASRRYLSVVSSEAPQRVPELVAVAEKKRARALSAIEKIYADVHDAIAATNAIREADAALGLTPKNWHRTTASKQGLAGKATAGLNDVLAFLKADDPMVTGAYVLDGSPTVPMHTRLALLESGRNVDEWVLFQIEASESWRVTGYTKGLKLVHQVAEDFAAEYLSRKELPRG